MSTPQVFASWTPQEAWLGCELARRGLVASIDGAPARRAVLAEEAQPSDPFTVELIPDEREARLKIYIVGHRARLDLDPAVLRGCRWRSDWLLELTRTHTEPRLLAPGEPLDLDGLGGACTLIAKLLRKRRYLLPEGRASSLRVRLEERSFFQRTEQSSAQLSPRDTYPLAWSTPTLPEGNPYWKIDLGESYFLPDLTLDLAAVESGSSLQIQGYSLPSPQGLPPPGSPRVSLDLDLYPPDATGLTRVSCKLDWVARFLRVEMRSARGPVVLAVAGIEAPGATLHGVTLRETWRRAFGLFRDRAMIVAPSPQGGFEPVLTYGEAGRRAQSLARGLAALLENPLPPARVLFLLATRNRPDWILADVAAIERGYIVAPVSPEEPDSRFQSVLERCKPAVALIEARDEARLAPLLRACPSVRVLLVCDASGPHAPSQESAAQGVIGEGIPRRINIENLYGFDGEAPEPVPYMEEDLYSLLFTSGSTGVPKGAMRSYASFHSMVASYGVPQPAFHLSFQSLTHLSERMYLPAILAHGGTVAFSRGGAFVMDELRAFAPTELGAVPRLFDLLYAQVQRRLQEGWSEHDAHEEARRAFGDRLELISVGSAPVRPEVLAFLQKIFSDIWVTEGYGTTEVGGIAGNGQVSSSVRVKLVPVPGQEPAELPRGEIRVRSPHTISGYFGDPVASAAALDEEGFFRTGDLGEQLPDGTIRVIGRLNNVVKLAHGEFVAVEEIERTLASCPVVDWLCAHAAPGDSGVAALVVPERAELGRLLQVQDASLEELLRHPDATACVLKALHQHGTKGLLAAHELPRRVVLDAEAPSVENGRLTASGKIARPAVAARIAALLGSPATSAPASPLSALAARFAEVASSVLGRPVSTTEPLGATLDSLGAAALLEALSGALGRTIPLRDWFAAPSLETLAASLEQGPGALSRALLDVASRELARPLPLVSGRPRSPRALSRVLLTGATGFLGAHLLESLLMRTPWDVLCLVRARSQEDGEARLRSVGARYGIKAPWMRRVRVIVGDLAAPELGLSGASIDDALRADAVVHAGAEVSWLAPYEKLRGANVEGSRSVLELASRGGMRLHLVSTISTAPVGGEEERSLTLEQAAYSSPYVLSKWLAERTVLRAVEQGFPLDVSRPGMIAPHSQRASGNPEDFLHRYLLGCVALGLYLDLPDQRLDFTPVDFVADAVVTLLQEPLACGAIYHLTNVEQSPTYQSLGQAMQRAGIPVEPASYEAFRAALLGEEGERASELRALGAFFPEGGGVGMGPWPSRRSKDRLAGLGVRCPAIDEAYVRRWLRSITRGRRSGG